MHSQRGNGKGLVVVALAASAFIATAANADMVSFTTVVTNNTTQEKVYDFNKIIALSVGGNLGGSGSIAITVTDLRGGGAYVKSIDANPIYSGFINTNLVAHLTPQNQYGNSVSVLAGEFSNGSYSQTFSQQSYGVLGHIGDTIQTRLKFILSAGDQATVSSTFVVQASAIPSPGALALVFLAGSFGLCGRRRSIN